MKEYIKALAYIIKKAGPAIANNTNGAIQAQALMLQKMKALTKMHDVQLSPEDFDDALAYGGWDAALRRMIIEKKTYCYFCSYELGEAVSKCPNCGKEVVDISDISIGDVDINLDDI